MASRLSDSILAEGGHRNWTFIEKVAAANPELVDLSPLLEGVALQLRKDVPLQLVVNMFQKMVRHPKPALIYFSLCEFRISDMCCSRKAGS